MREFLMWIVKYILDIRKEMYYFEETSNMLI